jgi:hypothetical protein
MPECELLWSPSIPVPPPAGRERTTAGYRYHVERHLKRWLRRSLRDIGQDRTGVRAEHERIASAAGVRTADYTLNVVRVLYNGALREQPDLPPNPCVVIDFQPIRRRKVDLDPDRLKAWGRAVLPPGGICTCSCSSPECGAPRRARRSPRMSTCKPPRSTCRDRRAARIGPSTCRCLRRWWICSVTDSRRTKR